MKARTALLTVLTVSVLTASLLSSSIASANKETAPGKTTVDLTPQERAWLRKNPVLTVITDGDMAPYGFADEQGRYIGVMPDIAARLEELLGLRIKFRPMTYAAMVEHVRHGTAEAATLVDALDAPYEQHYLMTDEVLFMPYALFVRKGSDLAAHLPEAITGKTIALVAGWDLKNPSLDTLRGNSFVFGDSYLEAITLVLQGKADAFFDVHPATNYILAKNFIQELISVKVYHDGYPAAFFVRKEFPELHTALQKALGTISHEERLGLLKKWTAFMDDAAFRLTVLDLTTQERTWLKNHPVIRVGIDANRAPLEFADADGHSQGLSIDYLRQFEKMFGMRFEIMSGRAWSDYLDMVLRGEIDMLSCVVEMPSRMGKLAFTKPYISVPLVILTSSDVPYVSGLKELKGKKAAVVKGYAVQEWLAKDFSGIELVPAASVKDMFRLLENRQVYACVESLPTAGYYLGKQGNSSIKVSGQTPYVYKMSMAVRSDYQPLANILQKALDAIPPEQREEDQRKWMAVAHERLPDYGLLWKVALPLVLLLVVLAYWTRRLFREVGSRKRAEGLLRKAQQSLEQMNHELDARVRLRTLELEQATHTLRESEGRFRAIAENVPDAVIITDIKGIISYCNSAAEKMFGYGQQEMAGQPHSILLPQRLREAELEELRSFIGADGLASICTPVQKALAMRKDGAEFSVEFPFFSWRIDDEVFFTAIMRDITERERAENEVRLARDYLENIFKASPDSIMVVDPDGYILMANDSVYSVYGYIPEEIVGQHVSLVAVQEETAVQKTFCMMEELYEKGFVKNFASQRRKKDGSIIETEVSIVLLKNPDGRFSAISSSRDITDRKRSEEQLRLARDYLENIFRASPDAILVTDAGGTIVMANDSVRDVYGYAPEEIIGQHGSIFTPHNEKAQEKTMAVFEELYEKGFVRNFEHERKLKDGSIIWTEASYVLLKNPDGSIAGSVSSNRDITDRKRLEEQLRQSQKMEAVGTLAGGIAHDFNNILGVIFGYAELSQDLAAGNSALEKNLEQILKAADRAKNLVQQILSFSRKTESQLKPLQMNLIIKEALKLLRASLPSTISILSGIDDTDDVVVADATQLHQIIMNLCTNAAQAMQHSGGTLEVKLKPLAIDEYSVKSYSSIEPGPYVQLSVRDTGTGIPAGIIGRIFEPFFTTKDVGKGTGMGLAMVHGIVKSLKGDIKVYSEPGKGSVFHVLLPRVEETLPESGVAVQEVPTGHESVLLVDDETMLIDVGTQMLESLGYRVTALQNPLEALEVFKKNPEGFDFVITDQTMPQLTGYELAQQLMQVRPDISIILCTGYSDLVTTESALAGGIKAFIIKPLNRLALAEKIRRVLDKSAA